MNAWQELIADATVAPVDVPAGAKLTASLDVPTCPQCGSPVKQLSRNDRACCSCGLTWTVYTERDELDAKADREVRSREFSENQQRGRRIPRGATRW